MPNLRHVAYSLASHNALAGGSNTGDAISRAMSLTGSTDDLLVVFTTASAIDLHRFDAGRWPADAQIVWRGANELAQSYRATEAPKMPYELVFVGHVIPDAHYARHHATFESAQAEAQRVLFEASREFGGIPNHPVGHWKGIVYGPGLDASGYTVTH
jgi:hypothetical protein